MPRFTIGKLSKAAHVAIDTIRFYEKCGLLEPPARRPSGFREYTEADLQRLIFVRRAREIGFSIEEITQLLVTDGADHTLSEAALNEKLSLIEGRIAELRRWRAMLLAWREQRPHELPSASIVDVVRLAPAPNECPPACACNETTLLSSTAP